MRASRRSFFIAIAGSVAVRSVAGSHPRDALVWMGRRREAKRNECRKAAESRARSEEHTSELQSLMRISYAVFCLKKKKNLIPNSPATDYSLQHTLKKQTN